MKFNFCNTDKKFKTLSPLNKNLANLTQNQVKQDTITAFYKIEFIAIHFKYATKNKRFLLKM